MLHCTVQTLHANPANLDRIVGIIKSQVIPKISKENGLKVAYYVSNSKGDMWMFQVWEKEEQFRGWQAKPDHNSAAGEIRSLRDGPLNVDGYQLQAHFAADGR